LKISKNKKKDTQKKDKGRTVLGKANTTPLSNDQNQKLNRTFSTFHYIVKKEKTHHVQTE